LISALSILAQDEKRIIGDTFIDKFDVSNELTPDQVKGMK
jgi:hypothetical protein